MSSKPAVPTPFEDLPRPATIQSEHDDDEKNDDPSCGMPAPLGQEDLTTPMPGVYKRPRRIDNTPDARQPRRQMPRLSPAASSPGCSEGAAASSEGAERKIWMRACNGCGVELHVRRTRCNSCGAVQTSKRALATAKAEADAKEAQVVAEARTRVEAEAAALGLASFAEAKASEASSASALAMLASGASSSAGGTAQRSGLSAQVRAMLSKLPPETLLKLRRLHKLRGLLNRASKDAPPDAAPSSPAPSTPAPSKGKGGKAKGRDDGDADESKEAEGSPMAMLAKVACM